MQQPSEGVRGHTHDLGIQVSGLRGQDLEEEIVGVGIQHLREVAQGPEPHQGVRVVLGEPSNATAGAVRDE